MTRTQRGMQQMAMSLLLSKFGETFHTMSFEPEARPDGSIIWSEDASVEPDWEERLPGWWDMLSELEPELNRLGYTLQVQEDGEYFGGLLTPNRS